MVFCTLTQIDCLLKMIALEYSCQA
jgi:hypothetical protein